MRFLKKIPEFSVLVAIGIAAIIEALKYIRFIWFK